VERLLDLLDRNINRFLSFDVSPIAVFGDSVENLADHRSERNVPFILLSDENFELHDHFRGSDGNLAAVWIVNNDSIVLDIVPMLPPTELVAVSIDRAHRALAEDRRKN
jgi:peroxiredoxin